MLEGHLKTFSQHFWKALLVSLVSRARAIAGFGQEHGVHPALGLQGGPEAEENYAL